jgi:hypothetical protein
MFSVLLPPGPNILFSILFSDNLCTSSLVRLSDQVSDPYKTTGRIVKAVPLRAMDVLGGEVWLLLILDLGSRWVRVVSITPQPRFTAGERAPSTIG